MPEFTVQTQIGDGAQIVGVESALEGDVDETLRLARSRAEQLELLDRTADDSAEHHAEAVDEHEPGHRERLTFHGESTIARFGMVVVSLRQLVEVLGDSSLVLEPALGLAEELRFVFDRVTLLRAERVGRHHREGCEAR